MIHLLFALLIAAPDRQAAHADALCIAKGYVNGVDSFVPTPNLGPGSWLVLCHPTKWQREHNLHPLYIRASQL